MVIDSLGGVLVGMFSSLVVGTTMYAFRRAGSHRDQTAGHEARLAAIEAKLASMKESLDRIFERLEHLGDHR